MGVYELDDDLVRRVITGRTTGTDQDALFLKLEAQVPIPVPQNIGAVVETDSALNAPGLTVFVRWAHDNQTTSPWIAVGNHEEPYRTDQIGRIVEVLTPGMTDAATSETAQTRCPYTILDPYRLCVLNEGHYGVGDNKGAHIDADGCVFQ